MKSLIIQRIHELIADPQFSSQVAPLFSDYYKKRVPFGGRLVELTPPTWCTTSLQDLETMPELTLLLTFEIAIMKAYQQH